MSESIEFVILSESSLNKWRKPCEKDGKPHLAQIIFSEDQKIETEDETFDTPLFHAQCMKCGLQGVFHQIYPEDLF